MNKIITHSNWASAAAVAISFEDAIGWATNTGMSVPDRSGSWTSLTIMSMRIVVWKVMRASAVVSRVVPDMRSSAGNTVSGVRVEIRSTGIAHTFSQSFIEAESRRAAVTFFGNIVPVSVIRAAFTSLGSSVPVMRIIASNACSLSSEVGFVMWA